MPITYMIRNQIFTVVYKILGPQFSTRLSQSFLGQIISSCTVGRGNSLRVFNGKYGLKLLLTPQETKVLGFYHLGELNPFETHFLQTLLQPGQVFVDVGTYVDGWHSLIASKIVGEKGRVVSFEPHPAYFKRLRQNIALNNIRNVFPFRFAISDTNETARFFQNGEASSLESNSSTGSSFQVNSIRLDDFIKKTKLLRVDVLKIDVEGAEMKVLKGAKHIILKWKPDLLLEVIDKQLQSFGSTRKELLSFLNELGYKAYVFTDQGIMPYYGLKQQHTLNMFFTVKSI